MEWEGKGKGGEERGRRGGKGGREEKGRVAYRDHAS